MKKETVLFRKKERKKEERKKERKKWNEKRNSFVHSYQNAFILESIQITRMVHFLSKESSYF